MTTSLPPVISQYLTAAEQGDVNALLECFTDDAAVTDEGRTWHGHAEIRRWRENVATAYEYTLAVLGAEPGGQARGLEWHRVLTHLEGNFPGGTVDLNCTFGLRDDRITELRIS